MLLRSFKERQMHRVMKVKGPQLRKSLGVPANSTSERVSPTGAEAQK